MRRGGSFTLEILIAMGIAVVAMIGVAQLMAFAAHQERNLDQRRQAVQEAANAIENMLALPWSELTADKIQALTLSPESKRLLPAAQLRWEIDSQAEPIPHQRITAVVTWINRTNAEQSAKLTAWRYSPEAVR